MVIASLALMFLNIYSASNTRELMFQAKYASVQDKIQVVASSFETADTLSTETVDQVISVLGDINVSRLLITDAEGKVLYDSSINQNAVGKYALLEAVAQALGGNDEIIHDFSYLTKIRKFGRNPQAARKIPDREQRHLRLLQTQGRTTDTSMCRGRNSRNGPGSCVDSARCRRAHLGFRRTGGLFRTDTHLGANGIRQRSKTHAHVRHAVSDVITSCPSYSS